MRMGRLLTIQCLGISLVPGEWGWCWCASCAEESDIQIHSGNLLLWLEKKLRLTDISYVIFCTYRQAGKKALQIWRSVYDVWAWSLLQGPLSVLTLSAAGGVNTIQDDKSSRQNKSTRSRISPWKDMRNVTIRFKNTKKYNHFIRNSLN